MRTYYVYLLEDENKKPFYVGKGSKTAAYDRLEYHIKYWKHNKNRKLINKIAKLNGTFNIVIVYESEDELTCFQKERELIQKIGRKNLCNLTDGGEGSSGWRHSASTKETMSAKAKLRTTTTLSNLKKACESNRGRRKASNIGIEELYKTMSIREIANKTGLDFATIKRFLVEKNLYVPNKNRRPYTEEARVAKKRGQENRVRRAILQYTTTGEFVRSWRCAAEAIKQYGRGIGDVLRGRQKTAYGFIWKYKEV